MLMSRNKLQHDSGQKTGIICEDIIFLGLYLDGYGQIWTVGQLC